MSKWIKRFICKCKGHEWEVYEYHTGYYSYDIEMAGRCSRCGLDTHDGYKGELDCQTE